MEKFIENFTEYKSNAKISEDASTLELHSKLKQLIEKAKESKKLSENAKTNYDNLIKNKGTAQEIEIQLLNYRKYKGKSDMLNAEVRLAQIHNKKLKDLDQDLETGINPLIDPNNKNQ